MDLFTLYLHVYTGNSWLDRKNFVKHPNKFYPLEIDYGQVYQDIVNRGEWL